MLNVQYNISNNKMELDLSKYPVGGYGVVLYEQQKNVNNEVSKIVHTLSMLQNIVLSIDCETIDGVRSKCTFDSFLSIFSIPSICLKVFHMSSTEDSTTPYEQERSIVKSLHSRLNQEELSKYTPVAYVNINNFDVSFIEINLSTPIFIRLGNGQKSESLSKLCCVVNNKFEDNAIQPEHIEPMKQILWFLNTKGIFHRDVKFENIMIHKDNIAYRPRLVDFGSMRIDDGRQDMMMWYNPTKFVHPFINYYFKKEISSRSVSHTIGRDLVPAFECEMKSFIDENRASKYFTQYMLHKKDCFDFAMWCISTESIKSKVYKYSGGFSFRSLCSSKLKSYIDIRAVLDGKYTFLAPFIYMDNQDFSVFKNEYEKQMSQLEGGSKKKHAKQYIQLRSNNRRYLLRVDKNGKKYILENKQHVYLKDIKNKYRYVKSMDGGKS